MKELPVSYLTRIKLFTNKIEHYQQVNRLFRCNVLYFWFVVQYQYDIYHSAVLSGFEQISLLLIRSPAGAGSAFYREMVSSWTALNIQRRARMPNQVS